MAKKQKKINNKYMTVEEVESVKAMSNQELLKEFLVQNKALRIIKKKKKDDSEIKSLKEEIKKHRETSVSEKTLNELKKLKEQIKEIKTEIDKGIEDLLESLKEKNKDFREDMGYTKERLKLVQFLLDSREV